MEKDKLVAQLKNNWSRVAIITQDSRTLFERIYDCFEIIGELETGLTEGKMIVALKEKPNELRVVFERLLGNKDFFGKLNQLKEYSPIANNTRENDEVVIADEKNFNTVIGVIYIVRNNLRHGKKEYTPRSEKILKVVDDIFYKIVGGVRLKYLA